MIVLGMKSTVEKVALELDSFGSKQIPFATMLALNQTAKYAKKALAVTLPFTFDRPTPFTLNSLYVKPATKQNLVARVEHKDFAGKGSPASVYLQPQIEGGGRKQKRSEKVIGKLTGVPSGYITPGPGAKVDKYGNIPGSELTRILSAIGGLSEVGFLGNRTKASAKRRGSALQVFFIVRKGNKASLKPGIYQRITRTITTKGKGKNKSISQSAGSIVPVLFMNETVSYEKRYDFEGVVERTVAAEFEKQFRASLEYALSTAK